MDNSIILTDENGNEVHFEFLDLIQYDGKEYVVLIQDNEDEVVILQVESLDEENDSYVSVEDETLLLTIFNIFKEKNKNFFNFE